MSRKDHRRQPQPPRISVPVATVTVEAPRNRSTTPQRQQFQVRVENMLTQTLTVSILDESGAVQGLQLAPRGKSHPIDHGRVGTYTRDLESRGHVRIVPES